jgi:hypothetical protein
VFGFVDASGAVHSINKPLSLSRVFGFVDAIGAAHSINKPLSHFGIS